jgi:hypothetical protein|tara:strand:+ start:2598 stop:2984 length:387 start_codon:yes stop_codon:yes gene_type:complete
MTKKELVKLIQQVVKREIKAAVQNEMNEVLNVLEQKKPVLKKTSTRKKINYTENSMLNEILNETKSSSEFEAYPEMDASSLRSKFAGMQGGNTQHTDVTGRPVDIQALPDGLGNALTRDYSELVKRFK